MFKYFSNNYSLSDIFKYLMKYLENTASIIIFDFNSLCDKKLAKRDNDDEIPLYNFINILNHKNTIEFFIIDYKNDFKDIQFGLSINGMYDYLYELEVFNKNFLSKDSFVNYKNDIHMYNHIITTNKGLAFKTNIIYKLINDSLYQDTFDPPLTIFLIFHSLLDIISFKLKYPDLQNVHFIVFDLKNMQTQFSQNIINFLEEDNKLLE